MRNAETIAMVLLLLGLTSHPGEAEDDTSVGLIGTVAGAKDPNEKVGSLGVAAARFLSAEEPLRYAIFFENLETATAAAQDVVITDPLDIAKLDLGTLSLGPIAFGERTVIPPPGLGDFSQDVDLRPAKNLIVRIQAHVDRDSGLLTWRFGSIDPATGQATEDPLAGFLPPNVTSPEGEGSVLFTVKPKPGLATGTEVRNRASIVFDVNLPLDTPEWLNTLDNTKPESHVLTLPAQESSAAFPVGWAGTDEGSGIRDYTIFVSEEGGPFTPLLRDTTATSAMFSGRPGWSYAFFSVARDETGNREDASLIADATTRVIDDTTAPTTTASLSPQPNAAGWNNSAVMLTLAASDNDGGSSVKELIVSASGAHTIPRTTVPGASTSIDLTAQGETTVAYQARDEVGNLEPPRTVVVKIDSIAPVVTFGSPAPTPNGSGWNNTDVSIPFTSSDGGGSGVAGTAPAASPFVLSADGPGVAGPVVVTDVAGNSATFTSPAVNIDKSPPLIAGSRSPEANAGGWNNTDVAVRFTCTDALSLIASCGPTPQVVVAEGAAQLRRGTTTDAAGNFAVATVSGISIDKTAPEAYTRFDPETKRMLVFGRDSLAGVPPGSVAPSLVVPTSSSGPEELGDGDDSCHETGTVEVRTYEVTDLAGNSLMLAQREKAHGDHGHGEKQGHIDVRIVRLRYNEGRVILAPYNRARVEWSLERNGTLKELEQKMELRNGRDRQEVEASFEAKRNQTTLRIRDSRPERRIVQPGLVLLRMTTRNGALAIEF